LFVLLAAKNCLFSKFKPTHHNNLLLEFTGLYSEFTVKMYNMKFYSQAL